MKFREWQYLREHPAVWRILLGIMVIPLVYAATFLASVWNPYGELHRLPMAVVNQDRPVEGVDWGQSVTRSLVRSHTLQFHRFTKKRALQDLHSGKVYLVLRIPNDASWQLRHLGSRARVLKVTYETNAGQSAVAAKMGNSAMQKLQATLNREIVQSELAQLQASSAKLGRQLGETSQQLAQTTQVVAAGMTSPQVTAADLAISQGLQQGSRQITAQAQAPAKLKALSAPIKLVQHDVAPIANNGTGMAPYFMAISLFVGCITLNIIYDAGKRHGQARNFLTAWIDKMAFLWVFVILAASGMWLGVWYINGLRPLEPGKTYLFGLLVIVAFFSIVTCFRLWFGLTGAWLMLLFMLFQIGCSGGTYPIELTNKLYETVHPYLPMTIAMAGFRHTISLGGSIAPIVGILVGIIVVFSLGTLGYFYAHRQDPVND